MADEANYQSLESKIALARRELNNLRSDIYSMKKMFAQKFKEIKGMVETGKVTYILYCHLPNGAFQEQLLN